MKQTNRFPPEWDEERTQRVIQHYDSLSEEDAAAEDDAPIEDSAQAKPKRQFGSMKGLISIDERFFEPLPEEELRLWEGR